MRSVILASAARILFPLLLLFSVFLLFRGHNEPGGGFVGGLVAATAYCAPRPDRWSRFRAASPAGPARGPHRHRPPRGPREAASSSLAAGRPFMTGLWGETPLPVIGKPGTPVLFDTGVYVTVLGVVLLILLTLQEEDEP